MKNIVRWTVGDVSSEGFECLERSVSNFIKLYKDQFDYFICYNNINEEKLKWSKNLKINLINQHKYENSLDIRPINGNPCWKLYPPRININCYEILLDNDLILYKKIDLEEIIKLNIFFITEALEKNYGSLNSIIKKEPYYNTGFFGIPSNFDIKEKINEVIKKFKIRWNKSHFEEQGVISYIIKNNKHKVINLDKIYVSFGDYQLAKNGYHFAGINNDIKKFWNFHNTKFL